MPDPFTGSEPGQAGEGPSPNLSVAPPSLEVNLRGLILWRLVFLSLLLLAVVLRGREGVFGFPASLVPFYFLLGLQYVLSLVYLFLLRRRKGAKGSAIVQLTVDGLFVTAWVYLTGGAESLLSFLYFLVILAGGVLFNRPGGMWTATYVFVSYALILFLHGGDGIASFFGLPERSGSISFRYALYLLIMNGIGFYFVGYLGSHFAEQTRRQYRQIEAQRKDITRLEQWNRLVVENLDMGLMTLDREGRILSINPAGEKILRRPVRALIGRPLNDFFLLGREGEEGRSGVDGRRMETRYTPPDGSPLIIGFSLYSVQEETAGTKAMGTIVTFKDITEIKAMEERLRQMDRLALMGRMAAGIAHEIRNPLASISGSLQLFQETLQDFEAGEQLLGIIFRELNTLDSLINDFLTFSRPVQPPPQPLNVSQLIEETVTLFQKGKEVTPAIRFRVEVEGGLFFKIPARELSRILWNLLTNALQALPGEGEITVRARRVRREEGEGHWEIVIRDNGCGIPEEDQDRIFEPFFTTKEKGTGLGLSIVQKIVSDLGGKISLESRPGEGTTFFLQFPLS
jgi:two-component system sensor histidine kinase PilS (NtrC family)